MIIFFMLELFIRSALDDFHGLLSDIMLDACLFLLTKYIHYFIGSRCELFQCF